MYLGIKCVASGPSQCGSIGWASSCKPKGHRFHSRSGHMPGLQVPPPVRAPAEGSGLMILSDLHVSLPFHLPPSPSLFKKKVWLINMLSAHTLAAAEGLSALTSFLPFLYDFSAGVFYFVACYIVAGYGPDDWTLLFHVLLLQLTVSFELLYTHNQYSKML